MSDSIKKAATSKISKYTIGGGINYALKLGLTYFLTEILALYYLFSYSITLVVVILYSFYYNMYITFEKTEDKLNKFVKYIYALIIFAFIDIALVRFFTEVILFHYLVSIVIVTTVIFLAKFIVFNKIVFKH